MSVNLRNDYDKRSENKVSNEHTNLPLFTLFLRDKSISKRILNT